MDLVIGTNDSIVTLARLRQEEPLDDVAKYPDVNVLAARDAVIEVLEDECRTGFVRRQRTEQFGDGVVMGSVVLDRGGGTNRHPGPTILAVSIGGYPQPVLPLGVFIVGRGGLLMRQYGGFGNVAEVTYEHGYEVCPGAVARIVRLLAIDWLTMERGSAVPDRATSMTSGDTTYRFVTAGVRGALFDLPAANAVVEQYRE